MDRPFEVVASQPVVSASAPGGRDWPGQFIDKQQRLLPGVGGRAPRPEEGQAPGEEGEQQDGVVHR